MDATLSLGNDLTPDSNTRDILSWLCEAYAQKSPDFARARITMESWADVLSKAEGQLELFPMTAPGKEVTMGGLLGAMGREQASRFLGELFSDIIPHLHSKDRLFKDLDEGKAQSGTTVRGPKFFHSLFRAMGKLDPSQVDVEVQVLELTWKDDGLNEIHNQTFVSAQVEEGIPRPPSRKGVSF